MILVALLPTGIMMGGYALAGDTALHEFIYANFISIFDRHGLQLSARLAGAAYFLLYLLPLLGLGGWGAINRWRANRHDVGQLLLLGWMAASLLGYLSVPAFFDHYALPVLVPFSVAAAITFERRTRWLLFLGLAAFYLIDGTIADWSTNRREAQLYTVLKDAAYSASRGGCIYVADGPSRLYSDLPTCRPTRYLFPDHLVLLTEADAIGTDPAKELARILAERPAVVVTRPRPESRLPSIDALLESHLSSDYRPVLVLPKSYNPSLDRVSVWQRNDLAR